MSGWTLHLSSEVEKWYASLNEKSRGVADEHLEMLEELGNRLGMPHSRYLKGKLHELRFKCDGVQRRITYTLEPDRQIITLTTFRKQRDNERKEVERARTALKRRRP